MSTNNHNDEIDLFYFLDKIKSLYHSFLAGIYKSVQFVLRFWIIILILLVGGYFGGYFWQKSLPKVKMTTLIVQNNFNSSNYVYDAVKLLSLKQKQGDKSFLKRNGFDTENPDLVDIEIEPIVNINELLEKHETSDRNLDQYMSKIELEEEILQSEVFYSEYKYHKIILSTTKGGNEVINKILDYLNSNDIYNETKAIVIEETKLRIQRNNTSIENIDAVFKEFAGENSQEADIKPSQMFFKSLQNNNMHQLIDVKQELIEENKKLRSELIKYDSVVTLINKPEYFGAGGILTKKHLLLPLFLFFLFIGFFVARSIYLKGKQYAK